MHTLGYYVYYYLFMVCVYLATTGTNLQQLILVPYEVSESEPEENDDQPLMTSTPRHSPPIVSTNAYSGAMICPVMQNEDGDKEQEVEKENSMGNENKNRCPSNVCKMKKPNSRTWWVSCCKCGQWYHIRCVNLTKKRAQDDSFTCESC